MPQKRQKYTTNKGNKYIHCKETLVDTADFQKSIQSTILPEQRTCTLFIQEITLTKNIKRFNLLNIRSFSRGEVYESWVPVTRHPGKNHISDNIIPKEISDPFQLPYIPPEKHLLQWKDKTTTKQLAKSGHFYYTENEIGHFDVPVIQDMLRFYFWQKK